MKDFAQSKDPLTRAVFQGLDRLESNNERRRKMLDEMEASFAREMEPCATVREINEQIAAQNLRAADRFGHATENTD